MPSSSTPDLLFVYGTLRKDPNNEINHALLRSSTYVGHGRILGELYDLGKYPGVFVKDQCGETVVGEVYRLDGEQATEAWEGLDRYEGCSPGCPDPHEYQRRRVSIILDDGSEVDAWAYILTCLPPGAVRVPGGDYLAWRKERG